MSQSLSGYHRWSMMLFWNSAGSPKTSSCSDADGGVTSGPASARGAPVRKPVGPLGLVPPPNSCGCRDGPRPVKRTASTSSCGKATSVPSSRVST